MIRIADYIIDAVQKAGVDTIFMLTGRGILQLSDAVAKNEMINGVCTLHEQGASYAAMAYARAKGGLGACLVSTGCAATNAVTACLCAYQDSLPMIFISGQHVHDETTRYTGLPIRTYGSQESDIISIVESITKYAVMLTDPQKTVFETEKALFYALNGRKGPVWIDIPLDIQGMRIEPDEQDHFEPEELAEINADQIGEISDELSAAKRPLLFVGGGCHSAKSEVKQFIERSGIPAVYSVSACDVFGAGNELSLGAVSSIGAPRTGSFAFQNADYILVLGSKLCSETIGGVPEKIARDAKVTVVDIDLVEHTKKGIHVDRFVNADIKAFINALSTKMTGKEQIDKWRNKCLHWKAIFDIDKEAFVHETDVDNRIDLYDFAKRLSDKLSDNSTLITDAGLEQLIIPSTVSFKRDQRCLFPASQGAMGYAIPAIIGAYYAGCRDIVVVVGDGSIMMNIQELQIIAYYHIPVRIIVINNDMYSVIRSRQQDLFRNRTIGNDPSDGVPAPDFKALAATFGMNFMTITNNDELDEGLNSLFKTDEMIICEAYAKKTQKYFHMSFRKNEEGKMVRPSIEDQSPFMDRDLFKREMIVNLAD